MLLDEDPATLISSCAANFNLTPDKASLSRITSSLATLREARALRTSSLQTDMKKLSRQLTALEQQHQLTLSSHNGAAHAAEILRLDTEKFRVAKGASDLEIEGERLEAELEGLRGVLAEVEAQGVEGGERGRGATGSEDEVILKLKVYRSLGIDVEADPQSGIYNKAVVRNAVKGDVHVVNVDPKFSRFFYANYFWGTL